MLGVKWSEKQQGSRQLGPVQYMWLEVQHLRQQKHPELKASLGCTGVPASNKQTNTDRENIKEAPKAFGRRKRIKKGRGAQSSVWFCQEENTVGSQPCLGPQHLNFSAHCLPLLPSLEICPKLLQPHSMSNCPLLHTEAGAQTRQPPSRMVTERHQVKNSTCVSYTARSQSLPAPLASEPSRAFLINQTAYCPSHWADSCFPCLCSHWCSYASLVSHLPAMKSTRDDGQELSKEKRQETVGPYLFCSLEIVQQIS